MPGPADGSDVGVTYSDEGPRFYASGRLQLSFLLSCLLKIDMSAVCNARAFTGSLVAAFCPSIEA